MIFTGFSSVFIPQIKDNNFKKTILFFPAQSEEAAWGILEHEIEGHCNSQSQNGKKRQECVNAGSSTNLIY